MWTPTHIIVTVSKARNLLDKGKGGNDAYCMIGMGKEKFLTSVRTKTLSPVWDEQAEFELTERADLKLTVYHKSSIIDEFVGRVVINVSDLFNENNKAFTKWYKLQAKADKVENSKKPAKERGEIEVRVEFITKAKTGSVMDLSTFSKSKEKTLSLKNLKDKSSNLKQSLNDKFKLLRKPSKSKFNGENQLAEQARRMEGSKLDFLEGEDIGSLTSSYSSINGPRLTNDSKQMSRYNPSRSSFISGTSSRMDADSSSIADNSTHNEEDFNEENEEDFSASFNRNNSFRRSSLRRHSRLSSTNPFQAPRNLNQQDSVSSNNSDNQSDSNKIHIAPLPPFLGQSTQEQQQPSMQQRYDVLNSIIHEENTPVINTTSPSTPSHNENIPNSPGAKTNEIESSFANIFTSSFASGSAKTDEGIVLSTTQNSFDIATPLINSSMITNNHKRSEHLQVPGFEFSPKTAKDSSLSSFNSSAATITKSDLNKTNKQHGSKERTKYDEDDEQIDWASSDDEEIVKQEIESFERNQVLNIQPIDLLNSTVNDKQNNKQEINKQNDLEKKTNPNLKNNQPLETAKPSIFPQSTSFSIDLDPFSSSSSSSSVKSSTLALNKLDQPQNTTNFNFDNFDFFSPDKLTYPKPEPTTQISTNPFEDPFLNFNFNSKMSTEPENTIDSSEPIKFESLFTPFSVQPEPEEIQEQKQNEEPQQQQQVPVEEIKSNPFEEEEQEPPVKPEDEDSDSSNSYSVPAPISKSQRLSIQSTKINIEDPFVQLNQKTETIQEDTPVSQNDDTDNEKDLDDDMDNAFNNFSANLQIKSKQQPDEFSNLANELQEASRALGNIESQEENITDQIDLAASMAELEPEIVENEVRQVKSELLSENESESAQNAPNPFTINRVLRQSERRKLIPTQDLTSDLNSERDFSTHNSSFVSSNGKQRSETGQINSNRSSMRINFVDNSKLNNLDDDIKTPDFEHNYMFQDELNVKSDSDPSGNAKSHGLPDLVYQKEPAEKPKKYLEGLDGVNLTEVDVPDSLKKQLEYFDRDELLQLIAYQKKYLDFKESRIKDLENYIDNLVVKIIETEPLILMNASCILTKNRNFA